MTARSKALIAAAALLLIVVLAVPSPTTDAPLDPAALPVVEPSVVLPREHPARVATEDELAAQRARSVVLRFGRDPFRTRRSAVSERPPQVEPKVAEYDVLAQEVLLRAEPALVPRLTGISLGAAERWAILDREVVREGDELASGHRLAKIDRRSVTLVWDTEELVVELGGER